MTSSREPLATSSLSSKKAGRASYYIHYVDVLDDNHLNWQADLLLTVVNCIIPSTWDSFSEMPYFEQVLAAAFAS